MAERLHENELKAEELTRNWTSKWKESHKIIEVKETYLVRAVCRVSNICVRSRGAK